MILTNSNILRLLSSHEVVKSMPELLPFVEQIKAGRAKLQATSGCKPCQERGKLAPILIQAQNFIIKLPADRIQVFKQAIGAGTGKLLAYAPRGQGRGLVDLG
jgi:hypothetical protein